MNASQVTWLLLAIVVVGPAVVCLLSHLVPLVMVAVIAVVVVRIVWVQTDRW